MDELVEENSFEEICSDLLTECKRFGSIVSIFVPRPPRDIVETGDFAKLSTPMWGVGRVYIS